MLEVLGRKVSIPMYSCSLTGKLLKLVSIFNSEKPSLSVISLVSSNIQLCKRARVFCCG